MTLSTTAGSDRVGKRLVKLIRFAHAHGAGRLPYALLRKLTSLRWCSQWFQFSLVEVFTISTAKLKTSKRIPRAFVVRRAQKEDLPALQEYSGSPELVRDRLRRGDACFVTLVNDQISAAVWLAPGPNWYDEDWKELRCFFSVPAGVAWSYDGRGAKLGAWGGLMARLGHFADELGVAVIYTIIDYNNRPSIDGHRSLGYQRIGLISCIKLFGIALRVYKPRNGGWRFLPGHIGKLGLAVEERSRPLERPVPSASNGGDRQTPEVETSEREFEVLAHGGQISDPF
jgi:hypothetical protein